jgi:hypothetical protein
MWAMLFTAAAIHLYVKPGNFVEIAFVLSFAMLGVAAAAGAGQADTSGAVPAAVAFLPGLMLAVRPSLLDHAVPARCFWLVALAPVVLLPFLIPAVNRLPRWLIITLRTALVLAPLVAAVLIADQHAKIEFPTDEWE